MDDHSSYAGFNNRTLPHNIEAERGFLGALLIDNRAFKKVEGYLRPENFVTIAHRIIFEACIKLIEQGKTANPITLKPLFEQGGHLDEIGGTDYLAELAASAVTVINAGEYGRIIHDLHIKREIISTGQDLIEAGFSGDLETSGDEIVAKYISHFKKMIGTGVTTISTKRDVANRIAEKMGGEGIPRFPTGLPQLDRSMGGGLFQGKTYGFSARKKGGKTLLAGTVSYNLNEAKVPHMFIPMEMGDEEIEQRNIARHLKTNSINFLKPDPNGFLKERTLLYAQEVNNFTFYEYLPGGTLAEVKSAISRGIVQYGIKGAFIDYLQLIRGQRKDETLAEFLYRGPQELADFCKTEGIWLWINAQQNKAGEVRGGEGLTYACDQYYTMHRRDDEYGKMIATWMELEDSRYTIALNVGNKIGGGLDIIPQGPYFEDSTNIDPINPDPIYDDQEEIAF